MPEPRKHAYPAAFGTALVVAASNLITDFLHPALAVAMAIASFTVPLVILAVVFTVIVRGSPQTCGRVFRLLRMITNRAEPPPPDAQVPEPS